VNLISLDKPVVITEADKGWTSEPRKLKPRQFAKLELQERFLSADHLPVEAVAAFAGSKSAFGKRHALATVFAVNAVFVNQAFQGKGCGLALYLKALELVSSKGYWLVNDTKRTTSESAVATWRAVFRYAVKTMEGVPLPERLFDYEKQAEVVGYREGDRVVSSHRPVMAAFGLNEAGAELLRQFLRG